MSQQRQNNTDLSENDHRSRIVQDAEEAAGLPEVTPPTAPPPIDARNDEEKLKENRKNLGVDEDHETPKMKEGDRGTFP